MRIYRCEDFDNSNFYGSYEIKKQILLTDNNELKIVLDACNNNDETLKDWINMLGVNCTNAIVLNGSAIYEVNGEYFSLSQLSAGERMVLYIMACKKLNKKLLLHGLFERLGKPLRDVLDIIVTDYENLVVVLYCSAPTDNLLKFIVEV